MENKISTSIQYQLTNVKLFRDVFFDWKNFRELLGKGPIAMIQFLFDEWNEVKNTLSNRDDLIVKDLNKQVSINDFNATLIRSDTGIDIFFFIFPDYEFNDAASKYVALAMTPKMPRFFTLEYSENMNKERTFVIGEFILNLETSQTQHLNYGQVGDDNLSYFAGDIINILKNS